MDFLQINKDCGFQGMDLWFGSTWGSLHWWVWTKEGTPIWDGEPASFQEFEELALLWEAGTPYDKRYTCAPKLIAELGGSAKRLTLGKTAEWCAYNGGVRDLMADLRQHLGRPLVPELTDFKTISGTFTTLGNYTPLNSH